MFDLVIQPAVLFGIDPATKFVKYVDDENIDSQGVKVRCKFTDSLAEVKQKIRQAL
jgi:hypothetical protein